MATKPPLSPSSPPFPSTNPIPLLLSTSGSLASFFSLPLLSSSLFLYIISFNQLTRACLLSKMSYTLALQQVSKFPSVIGVHFCMHWNVQNTDTLISANLELSYLCNTIRVVVRDCVFLSGRGRGDYHRSSSYSEDYSSERGGYGGYYGNRGGGTAGTPAGTPGEGWPLEGGSRGGGYTPTSGRGASRANRDDNWRNPTPPQEEKSGSGPSAWSNNRQLPSPGPGMCMLLAVAYMCV